MGYLLPTSLAPLTLYLLVLFQHCSAQTEGDIGYDYQDAYDDDYEDEVLGVEPSFDVPIVNVTVVADQMALLPCSIDFLGKYKVTWTDHRLIPLSFEDRRVIDDPRFNIVRPFVKEWNLQISDVTWEDQGQYRCTVNTDPVKSKLVMLHVKVPAHIIDELSSDDVTVQEGDTVILVCNVTGVPKPEVTWYHRSAVSKLLDRQMIPDNKGEIIIISNVSRYCDDIYECVADNGVPPAVSRQMRVTVEFPPEIQMTNSRIGQHRGRETILECRVTAFPQAQNIWMKDGIPIENSLKHQVDLFHEGDHTITMSLRIYNIQSEDYGEYICDASNAHGKDSEATWLYEIKEAQYHSTLPTPPVVWVGAERTSPPAYTYRPNPTNKHKPLDNHDANSIHGKGNVPASGRVTGGASKVTQQIVTLLGVLHSLATIYLCQIGAL